MFSEFLYKYVKRLINVINSYVCLLISGPPPPPLPPPLKAPNNNNNNNTMNNNNANLQTNLMNGVQHQFHNLNGNAEHLDSDSGLEVVEEPTLRPSELVRGNHNRTMSTISGKLLLYIITYQI